MTNEEKMIQFDEYCSVAVSLVESNFEMSHNQNCLVEKKSLFHIDFRCRHCGEFVHTSASIDSRERWEDWEDGLKDHLKLHVEAEHPDDED